ncbi:hypothetical protein FB451DRAFT_75835 [Mycena latifolia]|nr:hypothetical protein FB451DRAFT_75835 [Mycena latifolia]
MHQAHNIAWDAVSANLIFIHENPSVTPRRTDLFPRGLASQANSLNHFARTLGTTIRKFSNTERTKYPTPNAAPFERTTELKMSWALFMYLFYNVLLSRPELHADDRYQSLGFFRRCVQIQMAFEHSADHGIVWGPRETEGLNATVKPLRDINELHEHLKAWFRVLYRYDMMEQMAGRSVDWEGNVALNVRWLWGFPMESVCDEDGQRYISHRFV